MLDNIEGIHSKIEKHKRSIRKLKVASLLVVYVVIQYLVLIAPSASRANRSNYYMSIGAMITYVSTFIYAYIRHRSAIRKLEKEITY